MRGIDVISLSPRIFLATAAVSILLLAFGYHCLFSYQLGAHVKAAWWLKNLYSYKDHIAAQTKSPKIMVISGSNSLFGLDSGIVSRRTGLPVVNLAGHAAMDLEYFYIKVRKHLRDGDVVVMPLEFIHMQRPRVTGWFVNNMLAWGKRDYLDELDLIGYLQFLVSVPKSRIYKGVLRQQGTNPILPESEVIEEVEHIHREEGAGWRGYTHASLSKYGDIISGNEITESLRNSSRKGFFYYDGWDISDRFFKVFSKIKKIVEKHHGTLIFTWSVTMKNKKFDLSKLKYQNNIDRIRTNLMNGGITPQCAPGDFHFDPELFFNTEYHLNKRGAVLRSENLARCINKVLAQAD